MISEELRLRLESYGKMSTEEQHCRRPEIMSAWRQLVYTYGATENDYRCINNIVLFPEMLYWLGRR